MLRVNIEELGGVVRRALETYRRGEPVVFLERGLPVGLLVFLPSAPQSETFLVWRILLEIPLPDAERGKPTEPSDPPDL